MQLALEMLLTLERGLGSSLSGWQLVSTREFTLQAWLADWASFIALSSCQQYDRPTT